MRNYFNFIKCVNLESYLGYLKSNLEHILDNVVCNYLKKACFQPRHEVDLIFLNFTFSKCKKKIFFFE
jgi:hypothetical protein